MKQEKWFERNFDFNNTENIFPSILERLEGTPIRLKDKCKAIPVNFLSVSINNTWTIKENIGHLSDLETLWQGRIEDIVQGNPELRAADLQNKKTASANHNGTLLQELLGTFRQMRLQTIAMLEKTDDDAFLRTSFHPRLKKPMRIADLFLFVAEHDDHHLARITELVKILKGK
jgi:uncharacterized damage-inducible protein DinB